MSTETGIECFFQSFTVSNEKDAGNVAINKNVTPKK